jgi:UDP-N-acetylmuramoyl-L-alanyl-D-glutamate--2,6-diaminopimelate ligase
MREPTLDGLGLTRLGRDGPAPDGATPVAGIAVDSREVRPGFVFVAVSGHRLDGAAFAQYAVRQGAVAVVVTAEGLEAARRDIGDLPVPFFVADNPRAELARLAAAVHLRQPETMVAVTGTNGKTSVAQFTSQLWAALGHRAAAIGTTGVTGDGFAEPLAITTPEPVALHALLARLAGKGCTHAAMEASSHGLAQHRLDGVRLAAAAFTNISRDHLDYHASAADYAAAKMRLFAELLPPGRTAVLNAGDPVSVEARQVCVARGIDVLAVGRGADVALRLTEARYHPDGQEIAFSWRGRGHRAELALIGSFQAENALIAAGLAIATGGEPEAVFAALPGLRGVRGRMQRAATRANGAAVYVDYAHTPAALSTAIEALRPHVPGRLVVVFGAGGDRDPGKRPLMGRAVAEGADAAIVTDDNPRSEDPAAIRAAVLQGAPLAEEIGDRAQAILAGVEALKDSGDCLLVAGKGHEQGQEAGGRMLPFDDVEQARAAVTALDAIEQEYGQGHGPEQGPDHRPQHGKEYGKEYGA